MNGYTMMKESYQKLMEQGKIDEKKAKKEIRIYEFLETCDDEDKCMLVDSSAFNDIIKGYCEIAIEQGNTNGILDKINANDVLKKYYGKK